MSPSLLCEAAGHVRAGWAVGGGTGVVSVRRHNALTATGPEDAPDEEYAECMVEEKEERGEVATTDDPIAAFAGRMRLASSCSLSGP